MTSDISQTAQSLPILVSRLIAFRFISIEPADEQSQSFSWFGLEGASSYIVQLSDSQGIVFREKVAATNNIKETFVYKKRLLQPGDNYLFIVEVDLPGNNLDYCQINNEKNISEYVAKGIEKIKSLNLSGKSQANLIAELDSLLVARDEVLNIVWGDIRQGSNSDTICFLNYFLAQVSVFKLLVSASCVDEVVDAFSEIASQLAAANITLSDYLQLSEIQLSLAQIIAKKGLDLGFFAQNFQGVFQFNQLSFRSSSNRCDWYICYEKYPDWACGVLSNFCRDCPKCQQ